MNKLDKFKLCGEVKANIDGGRASNKYIMK
jgi:hypothetical protein